MGKQIIGAQGEITIIKLDTLPSDLDGQPAEICPKGWIISHSESGHHHILTGGTAMETIDRKRAGLKVIYALLDKPESLIQDAEIPHEGYKLDPGIYCFRVAREFDPFAKRYRPVTD